MATLYSYDCFILNASSLDDAQNEIFLAWGDIGGSILYLVSDKKKEVFPKLSNCGWLVVVLSEYHHTLFSPSMGASEFGFVVGHIYGYTGSSGKH